MANLPDTYVEVEDMVTGKLVGISLRASFDVISQFIIMLRDQEFAEHDLTWGPVPPVDHGNN